MLWQHTIIYISPNAHLAMRDKNVTRDGKRRDT
jgi:hypothetical protein